GNTELAVQMWNRSYMVQAVPYRTTFIVFNFAVTGGWIALILKGILPLKKVWHSRCNVIAVNCSDMEE
ncbi:MAG: hypothetical protein NC548_38025, partial [Lachnospiraceae bacterium]|nr:hypothetical protein [Lachnospiraceae bacterium]